MTLWGLLQLAALEEIAEIGYACINRDCDQIATCISGWPTLVGDSPHRCCDGHARAWKRVAAAMGFEITPKPLPVRRNLVFIDDATVRFGLLELD